MSRRIAEEGIYMSSVEYPAVGKDEAKLRIGIMATHTDDDIDRALGILKVVGQQQGIIGKEGP